MTHVNSRREEEEEEELAIPFTYLARGRFLGEIRHETIPSSAPNRVGEVEVVTKQNRSSGGSAVMSISLGEDDEEKREEKGQDNRTTVTFVNVKPPSGNDISNGNKKRRADDDDDDLRSEDDGKKKKRRWESIRIDLEKLNFNVSIRMDSLQVPEFWASAQIPLNDLLAKVLEHFDDEEEEEEQEEEEEEEFENSKEEEEEEEDEEKEEEPPGLEEDYTICPSCNYDCTDHPIGICPRCEKKAHLLFWCMDCFVKQEEEDFKLAERDKSKKKKEEKIEHTLPKYDCSFSSVRFCKCRKGDEKGYSHDSCIVEEHEVFAKQQKLGEDETM
jgi:hypothetical protein